MAYNELRKDYLLDRWVVIATERSRRPTDLKRSTPLTSASPTICPMCTGNEQMTPPATMLYLKDGNKIVKTHDPIVGERPKNWLVRCIPNLYPAFTQPKQSKDYENNFSTNNFSFAIGHHEVIVESPKHNEDPADAELPQLQLLIEAYTNRLRELSEKPYVKYVSIFRNQGLEAGASLSHAHSQIITTPIIPKTIQEELCLSKSYYERNGRCAYCDIIEKETESSRLIYETAEFAVIAPYASIFPLEMWILPKNHNMTLLNLSSLEVASFAKTLKTSLQALKDLMNDPPYNYGFHLSINPENQDSYHWHLEIYPKLAIWAGFEKSTGIYINTVQPETTAESLKKQIKTRESTLRSNI